VEYEFSAGSTKLLMFYHYRIKIYKEDGEEYATFQVPLHGDGGTRERVTAIKGFTYNAVGGKIEKLKLDKSDIFYEDTADKLTTVKFALPGVRNGSIIDVKFEKSSPYVTSIDRFNFQHFIPVDHAEYKIAVPEYFSMSPVPKGFVPLTTDKKSEYINGYNEDTYTFIAKAIPSIKEDDYVLNVNDYRGSIKYEISSYQFPGGAREKLSGDWNYVAETLMDHKKIGGVLRASSKMYADIVAQATGTDDEKIAFLYNYIQTNFTWNDVYTKYASQTAKEFLKSKSGNVADINMLLLNLLRSADISADAIMTRYRFTGILNGNFPSPTELNYFMVRTNYKGKPVFLDATSKYVQIGQLPIRAVNLNALVVNKNNGEIISIQNPNVNKRKFMGDYTIDLEESVMVGTSKGRLADFAGIKFRQSADEKNEEVDEDNQDLESDEVKF